MMRSRSRRDLLLSGLTSPGNTVQVNTPRAIRTYYYAGRPRRLRETWRMHRYTPSVTGTGRITTASELCISCNAPQLWVDGRTPGEGYLADCS